MGAADSEITIADVYQAMLSQREWFSERLSGLESSMRADVGHVRDDLVGIQVAVAGLPCKHHGEALDKAQREVNQLGKSVNIAKLLAGVPAALATLAAAVLAFLGISGARP